MMDLYSIVEIFGIIVLTFCMAISSNKRNIYFLIYYSVCLSCLVVFGSRSKHEKCRQDQKLIVINDKDEILKHLWEFDGTPNEFKETDIVVEEKEDAKQKAGNNQGSEAKDK